MRTIRRLLSSTRHALNGIKHVVKYEKNFQLHLLATLLVIGLGLFIKISWTDWVIIFLIITMVLVLEMINSIIEEILDATSPHFNSSTRIVKDVMAGVVLVASVAAVIIGALIFGPHIV